MTAGATSHNSKRQLADKQADLDGQELRLEEQAEQLQDSQSQCQDYQRQCAELRQQRAKLGLELRAVCGQAQQLPDGEREEMDQQLGAAQREVLQLRSQLEAALVRAFDAERELAASQQSTRGSSSSRPPAAPR